MNPCCSSLSCPYLWACSFSLPPDNQSKEDAKTLGEFPLVSLDSSASVKCEDSEDSSLCSKGSTCMNGDLGVFCQCYTGSISENEVASPLNSIVISSCDGSTYEYIRLSPFTPSTEIDPCFSSSPGFPSDRSIPDDLANESACSNVRLLCKMNPNRLPSPPPPPIIYV